MCGIVGYIGGGNVYDILIKGLHRLEYRGYDSAGVALAANGGKLNVYKTMGKVSIPAGPPMASLPTPMPIRITARTAT